MPKKSTAPRVWIKLNLKKKYPCSPIYLEARWRNFNIHETAHHLRHYIYTKKIIYYGVILNFNRACFFHSKAEPPFFYCWMPEKMVIAELGKILSQLNDAFYSYKCAPFFIFARRLAPGISDFQSRDVSNLSAKSKPTT